MTLRTACEPNWIKTDPTIYNHQMNTLNLSESQYDGSQNAEAGDDIKVKASLGNIARACLKEK